MENQKVLVVGISRYSFEDRETKKQIEGCKVHFLNTDKSNEKDSSGYLPSSANLPYESFGALSNLNLPHMCEAVVNVSFTGRKPQVKISDFKPIKAVALNLV